MGSRVCVAAGSLCAYPYAPEIHPPSPEFPFRGTSGSRKEDAALMAARLPMRCRVADWGESEMEEEDGSSSYRSE